VTLPKAILALLLLSAVLWCIACGGSDSPSGQADLSKVPTATLPAALPEPTIVEGTPQPAAPAGNTYVVEAGDSLYAIAERFGVTVEELAELNELADPRQLEVGQVLRIPDTAVISPTPEGTTSTSTPTPSGPTKTPRPIGTPGEGETTYTVQSGDNANDIALSFGITVEELAAANNTTVDNLRSLQVGDVLIIPAASATPTPMPTEEPTSIPTEMATPEG
jgi:LysM repeat protein